MTSDRALTTTEVLAAATSELEDGGYQRIRESLVQDWRLPNGRLFEDKFGIVAVVVFDTWRELFRDWSEAQALLAALITKHMSRSEPKAWDGYLVLLTSGVRGTQGQDEWAEIRYNTSRVRKLVASGENLKSLASVRDVLLPLLPVQSRRQDDGPPKSILDSIPLILSEQANIDRNSTEAVVAAFREQRNMLQALHDHRMSKS